MVQAVTMPISEAPALAPGETMPTEVTPTTEMTPGTVATPPAGAAPEGTPEKFLNADGTVNTLALVESYKNLETKIGDPGGTDKVEGTEEGATSYGAAIDGVLGQAGLTPAAVNKEWQDTGSLSDDTMSKLEKAGFSKDVVNNYIKGAAAQVQAAEQGTAIAAQQEQEIMATVGGEEAYRSMTAWAGTNLTESEVKAYDEVVSGGNRAMIDIAVSGLQAKYHQAEGRQGQLAMGGMAGARTDVFNSMQEMSVAMTEARATRDPAKIAAVEQKAMRSPNI